MDVNLLISERPNNEIQHSNENEVNMYLKRRKVLKKSSNPSNINYLQRNIEEDLGVELEWDNENEKIVRNILEKNNRLKSLQSKICGNEECLRLAEECGELKTIVTKLRGTLKLAKIEISKHKAQNVNPFTSPTENQTREFLLKERIEILKIEVDELKNEKLKSQETHRKEVSKLRSLIEELKCHRTKKCEPNVKIESNKQHDLSSMNSRLRIQLSEEKSKVDSLQKKLKEMEKELTTEKTKFHSLHSSTRIEEMKTLKKNNVSSKLISEVIEFEDRIAIP